MNGQPAPLVGPRAWIGSALMVVSVLTGVWTLGTLIAPGAWRSVAVVVVLLLAVVTTSIRQRTRSHAAPTAWGLAAGVVLLGSLYAGRGTTPSLPLPTMETVERFTRLASSGITAIVEGRIPVEPARGVELLVVTGAVVAFLAADLVGVGLGRAGLSGLFVVGLWAPAVVFERSPSVTLMVLGGLAFLLLLAMTRPQPSHGARGLLADSLPAVSAAAGVTLLALLAGPVAAALPVYGSVRLPATWGPGTGDGPLRLSTDLDMRSSLPERSDRPILTYTTDASDLGPLRMYTMVDFDGREWDRGQESGELVRAQGWLWPTDGPEPVVENTNRVSIQVGDLDQDRLPIPVNPRDLDVAGSWLYDVRRDEVVAAGTTTRDLRYVVTVAPRSLTPDVLRADGPGTAFDAESPLLAVPESVHVADIRATAADVTAGATNAYDQALALQTYFRDIGTFRYDTDVPPPLTEDAVWDFLTQRTGYCVQYATAMTIMARSVGIPARLAIGFLPGRPSTEVRGLYTVTGRQAHAWPELYFAGAGWVRFEPTPAGQTGAPPLYADPYAGIPVGPDGLPTSAATQQPLTPGATVPGGQSASVGGRVSIGTASIPLIVVLLVVVLVIVLTALAVLAVVHRRRRTRVVRPVGPQGWWANLRSRLALLGVVWSDSTTPRHAAELLRERYLLLTETDDAVRALELLVGAVEAEAYAPHPADVPPERLEEWVDRIEQPLKAAAEAERPVPLAGVPVG